MVCLKLIVAICLLSELVSSMLVLPKCAENEEFSMCGHCEGSCSNPMPEGSGDCLPAGCYCPKFKGYVRSETGACIPHSRCPRLEQVVAQGPLNSDVFRDLPMYNA
ncbi:hypothetical protein L596_000342 [Steinernema carpocapsae]|uniref:TIL domain-containing protein n=1 Tax=Steinernema carpocapsae TaxID=34508 RepID=A0A4U8UI31_STECR|nr:hypothetical protein L596_000342 [Steinernema carpocapsae]